VGTALSPNRGSDHNAEATLREKEHEAHRDAEELQRIARDASQGFPNPREGAA
jgi:hypothetical protein